MKNKITTMIFLTTLLIALIAPTTAKAATDATSYSIPGKKGKITSNVWRSNYPSTSGNTGKYSYQVSAVYSGSKKVTEIKTTFRTGASLRNSASLNIGTSSGGASAGASSSWQTVSKTAYWINKNGSKTSSWRSNATFAPYRDYRKNTVFVMNTARVKLSGDQKPYEITASI
ncbi:hypothetical protein [Listeria sp. ILCC792]|uniref:hypothetical protein n=1 Tax=Listeria sp. ILCC792 TaxID=1918331 RepID=UPI000B592013|nr:hypothetical protein [Listeria sp. ILCC792]